MSSDELLVEKSGGICRITLNRPQVHNAFNDDLIAQMTQAFTALAAEDVGETRAVVLAGNGKSFCAGADLNWMKKMAGYSREENYRDSVRLAEMIEAIGRCPVPVVGRVHGAALGGGVGLVAVCDYVLMWEGASWGLTEVNLGLIPAVISSAVIEKIGLGQAKAHFLSGGRHGGERAFQLGLAHEVFASVEELDRRLEEFLEQLKGTGPLASRVAKELIWLQQSYGQRPEKMKDLSCQMIAVQRASDEGQEGMSALLERRVPNWKSST